MKLPIYMDNHATTPVEPRVLEAMEPCFRHFFGNSASTSHPYGWDAEQLVAESRNSIANIIGAASKEIVFTSGATESNNLAIKGVAAMYRERGNHLITQPTEHKCVLDTMKYLETQGFEVTYLKVDSTGLIDLEELKKSITDQTILISTMFANNEIGTIQPIAEIGRIAKEREILLHVDGAQGIGKLDFDVDRFGVDLLSFSGHKMYGPKGVGALYVRQYKPRVRLVPLMHGGGHEFGLRSGTLNVAGIVGLAKALEISRAEGDSEYERIQALRDRLEQGILSQLPGVTVNGHPEKRLANNLNLSVDDVEGESLIAELCHEIAVSSSSACMSGTSGTSYVLKALGLRSDRVQTSVRFGVGRFNKAEEIEFAIEYFTKIVKQLRQRSPLPHPKNT